MLKANFSIIKLIRNSKKKKENKKQDINHERIRFSIDTAVDC